MRTEVIKVESGRVSGGVLARAISVLAEGGLVAFPTETVYGVGASAARPEAVERLRRVKQRPASRPFTVHLGRPEDAALFVPEPSRLGRRLMQKAWPGPLTLVMEVGSPERAPIVQRLPAGQDRVIYHAGTVGLRCPDDAAALELLSRVGVPIVAASANRAGEPPPCRAEEVLEQLEGQVDVVVDGGTTRYARPSTIVRVDGDRYELLRHGVYDERTVRRLATVNLLFVCTGNSCRSPMAEGFCRKFLVELLGCRPDELAERGYRIASAGTMACAGGGASQNAIAVCRQRDIDISGHVSQPLTVELINQADHIFTMCDHHSEAVLRMVPSARERLARLDPSAEIEDPMGGDEAVYERCAKRIAEALSKRLKDLLL